MSRHLSYDDMLDQLDRFIESLDAKTPSAPAEEPTADEPPAEPELIYFDEPQENESSIRWKMPA
jgi:hypothetical protein